MAQAMASYRLWIRFILKIIVMVLLTAAVMSCGGTPSTGDRLDEYLSRAAEVWHFQGAALVARGGSVILSKGYGPADMENGIPNTAETKFLLGSTTKQFTAAAIMQLVEQGLVRLDSPVTAYLPDYPAETGNKISIHHLLSHTSGIPSQNARLISLMGNPGPLTANELIETFKNLPLDFEPGEKYTYSNCGYVLLGAIIERVSGQSYETYLREHIFDPLEMDNTGVYLDYAGRPDFAVGYQTDAAGKPVRVQPFNIAIGFSAGSLGSTVEDMLKWDQGLYAGKILQPNSVRLMFTPNLDDYGYGWLVQTAFGRKAVGHGGGTPGFGSWLERWVDDSVLVVVLSNNVNAPVFTIGRGLAAIALGENYELPAIKTAVRVDPAILTEYAGTYRIKEGQYRTITLQNGELYSQRTGSPPIKILPETDNRFFFAHDHTATLEFVRDSNGQVASVTLRLTGVESSEERVDNQVDP